MIAAAFTAALPAWFTATPQGKQVEAEAARQRIERRKAAIAELQLIDADHRLTAIRHAKAKAAAEAKLKAAREALRDATAGHNQAIQASWGASATHDRRRAELQRELTELRDDRITAALEWCATEIERLRALPPEVTREEYQTWAGAKSCVTHSTLPSCKDRLAGLTAAREEIERLAFDSIDDLDARIEKIKAALPTIRLVRVASVPVPDPSDRRNREPITV